NAVRPGVDIKSLMSYARWLGPGTGIVSQLPDAVQALAVKEPAAVRPPSRPVAAAAPVGGGECRHRSPVYLERGIAMAEQRITAAPDGIHKAVYRMFLAVL
ncbi:DNA primase, partial [Streptomyces sp. WAC05950]